MRRVAFAVVVATLCGSLALAGCKRAAPPQARATEPAQPDAKPGMALADLRIILPRVADRPAALYFTLTNSGAAPAKLVAVFVDGAMRADMHETEGTSMKALRAVDLAPGATVRFAPGGKHVMVYGIPGTWKQGDKPEVTLTFADGDKISGRAATQAPGSADAQDAVSMPGMKM